jgi:hypothetical protein
MTETKLYMLLLGCKPLGRLIEQHDIYFTIGKSLKDIIPEITDSWPGSGDIHLDAWREVTETDGYSISIEPRKAGEKKNDSLLKLFFINLGGYKPGEFEEYHYKMIAVAESKSAAIIQSKQTASYRHTGFKGAESHVDDKYGIDVDDLYEIEDILPGYVRKEYRIMISKTASGKKDEWHLGYTALSKIK